LQLLAKLDDPPTHAAVEAERSLLHALRGGCLAPVGAWGRIEADGRLHLSAVVLKADGSKRLFVEHTAAAAEAALGETAARDLLQQGAAQLIADSRSSPGHIAPH
jgi:hydroxymethylbilane synthase